MSSSAATSDERVQAIRCTQCCRLRPYPRTFGTRACMCGGLKFVGSFPMPGEEEWAVSIYKTDLQRDGLWTPALTMNRFNRKATG